MKRIVYRIIFWLGFFGLTACQHENELEQFAANADTWTLHLQTRAATDTQKPGDPTYNEDLIKKVDVYFFEDIAQNYIFCQQDIPVGSDGSLKVKVKEEMYGKSYTLYVIANGSKQYSTQAESLASLQAKVIHTAWKEGLPAGEGDLKEESLWMHGQKENVQVLKGQSSTIDLKRAMAKVVLTPTVEESITIDGVTYEPDLSAMEVTFVNAVNRMQLDGKYQVKAATDYLSRLKRAYKPGTTNYEHIPFYSYPNPLDTKDRKDSYLILCVPWRMTQGGNKQFVDYYYHVPITFGDVTLEANRYYQVNVKVGVLGSLNPREEVELTPDFVVMDWYNQTVDAEMSQYQYLVLDEYESVLYNEEEYLLPFISSSEVVVGSGNNQTKILSVEYMDYSLSGTIENCKAGLTQQQIINQGYKVEVVNNHLKFSHPISEEMYAPYTITVQVGNNQGITRIWEITQYPSIYITGQKAEGGLYVAGFSCTNGEYEKIDYKQYYLGSVQNPGTIHGNLSGNDNWNNYTIAVSAFKEGQDYAIGDPRSLSNNDLDLGTVLTNYRPTREKDTEKIIAPRFKIASSRGKMLPVTFKNAQRRCAAYQEDGFPAGRWRVPTEAEIQFIVNLSAEKKIPELFDGEYWSASGRYYSSSSQQFAPARSQYAVRCVYDVWYWGDEPAVNKNEFQWMDTPIE